MRYHQMHCCYWETEMLLLFLNTYLYFISVISQDKENMKSSNVFVGMLQCFFKPQKKNTLLLCMLTEETEDKWCVYYNLKTKFFTFTWWTHQCSLQWKQCHIARKDTLINGYLQHSESKACSFVYSSVTLRSLCRKRPRLSLVRLKFQVHTKLIILMYRLGYKVTES